MIFLYLKIIFKYLQIRKQPNPWNPLIDQRVTFKNITGINYHNLPIHSIAYTDLVKELIAPNNLATLTYERYLEILQQHNPDTSLGLCYT